MSNVVICGAGKMGVAIGYAMKKLGCKISVIDNNDDNIELFCKLNGDCQRYNHWSRLDKKV